MHINFVALPVYYILLLKLRTACLDKSQMGIYIYLDISYKFIKNSHFNFRPTVK